MSSLKDTEMAGDDLTPRLTFYPIYEGPDISFAGYGMKPFLQYDGAEREIPTLTNSITNKNKRKNIAELIIKQSISKVMEHLEEAELTGKLFLYCPSAIRRFGLFDIVSQLENCLIDVLGNDFTSFQSLPFELKIGIDSEGLEKLVANKPERIEALVSSDISFVFQNFSRSSVPMMQLKNTPIDMVSVPCESVDQLDDTPEYFRNLTTYANSLEIDIHLTNISSRRYLQNALDWNFDYLSGELFGEKNSNIEKLNHNPDYSLQMADVTSTNLSEQQTLEQSTILGDPYSLIVASDKTLRDLLSLPLGFKKIPHRTCKTLNKANENIEQYEIDLVIVSAGDFGRQNLLDFFESVGNNHGTTPRIVIKEKDDDDTAELTDGDQVTKLISKPVSFPKYLQVLEDITLQMERHGLRESDSNRLLSMSKKTFFYSTAVILALIFGIMLGPTIKQINSLTSDLLSGSDYFVNSIEEIKGYLARDEQRDIQRQ